MRTARSNPGYLLIELLAAITLLALAYAALMPTIASRAGVAGRRDTRSRIESIDALTRVAAISEGPLVLRIDTDASRLVVQSNDGAETIRSLIYNEADWYLVAPETDRPIGGVVVDRLGRSMAYTVVVRPRLGDQIRVRFGKLGALPDGDQQ